MDNLNLKTNEEPEMSFYNDDKEIGSFNIKTCEFKGDVKESAKIFWKQVCLDGKTLWEKISDLEAEIKELKEAK